MVLSEMEHLNLLMLFPLMKNSNLNPLRNIKYIETLQFYSETHDHEIQDRSFIENLLYLHIYDDTSGETGSVFSFIKNCENGGTFCHKKPEKYIGGILNEQGEKTKIINLFSPLFDLNAENDNIEFLKKNNVDITISE
jgi:diacylglycerol kinase family enzyme